MKVPGGGGYGEPERICVPERDVVAAGDADAVEVVSGIDQGDVIGAGGERGGVPTVNAPPWVSAPLLVMSRAPLTVDVPSISASLSVRATWFALVTSTRKKLLPACVSVMSLAPAASVVLPVTVRAPLWVMAPPALTPVTAGWNPSAVAVTAPIVNPLLFVKVRLPAAVQAASVTASQNVYTPVVLNAPVRLAVPPLPLTN